MTNGDTGGPPPTRHLHPVDLTEPPYDPEYDTPGFTNAALANTDAEIAILGALLLNPALAPDLENELTPDDFYKPAHGDIWSLIHNQTAQGNTPDQVTLARSLHQAGILKALPGGPAYLADLMQGCPNPAQAHTYAQIVRDTARLRRLDELGTHFRHLARTADPAEAGRHLERAFDDLEQVVTRWGPTTPTGAASGLVDLSWLLTGTPPAVEPPSILHRSDGTALFYTGKVNGIFGDPEAAKTWIAQAAMVETLHAGGRVAMIDVDHNGPVATAGRLSLLGAHVAHLADQTRFRYYQPDDPDELRAAIGELVTQPADVLLIDSIGEAIPMLGANTNDGDEITNAMRFLCTRPADAGTCVITIDHLPKGADARSTGYAIGSIAKKRMIRGAYLRAEARVKPAPGEKGLITLRIEKDTAGELRRTSAGGYAGTFTLDSRYPDDQDPGQPQGHGSITWSIVREAAPKNDDGTFRPTVLMEAVSRYVEDNDQCSRADIESDVKGKASTVRQALKLLIHEGFISTLPGARGAIRHHSIALYRQAEDDHLN